MTRSRRLVPAFALILLVVIFGGALLAPSTARADEGWVVNDMAIRYTVRTDGAVLVEEAIDADFGSLQKHGIIRSLVVRQKCSGGTPSGADGSVALTSCPQGSMRSYRIEDLRVSNADGKTLQVDRTTNGNLLDLRIGDPDRTISGPQEYRISYRLEGALNAFSDHDELYWNASGLWDVPIESVSVVVALPGRAPFDGLCFAGYSSATTRCQFEPATGLYAATRTLQPGEQLTVVAGWDRGVVEVPPALLSDIKTVGDFFTLDAVEYGGAAATGIAGLLGLGGLWWAFGRDRRYRTMVMLTGDASHAPANPLARDQVIVEFTPPDDLRPGEMGLILDERADTLDVSATLVDLAVRGYVTITEIPKKGWFGKRDWELNNVKLSDVGLEAYEAALLGGLFASGPTVRVSALKNTFKPRLDAVKATLYKDGERRKWFRGRPSVVRGVWAAAGVAFAVLGGVLAFAVGYAWGRSLITAPLVLVGLLLALLVSRAMPSRTAQGREVRRRVLGFRRYIETAETRRQEFNEQRGIFARYLPYAMVFGCVDRWAKAFEGLEMEQEVARSTAGWYVGAGAFSALALTDSMSSFSSTVSSTFSSTPGGSGGSGFSGGSSGGGGGGGGGSSW